jgi:hypothetical protein
MRGRLALGTAQLISDKTKEDNVKTKTITITDPEQFQEGDLFNAELVDPANPQARVLVEGVKLETSAAHDGRLYLRGHMRYPYANTTGPRGSGLSYWKDASVTREVPVRPNGQEVADGLPKGSVIRCGRLRADGSVNWEEATWYKSGNQWVSKNGSGPSGSELFSGFEIRVVLNGADR